jgi:Zn-finger nucleic acid-binding protein
MNCPACNVPLAMADRQGVEIDYCPRCRGVWLDRGEIDKIVEREAAAYGPMPRREAAPLMPEGPFYRDDRDHDRRYHDRDHDDRYRYDDKYRKKKKRESFLEDLFDFG